MKLTKMAFEINDLKGILIFALFAIPLVASTNINCSGRAFHCVNSTHFMICVDLGGGVSTTIDDFVIPCPATTVCHKNNVFECDFPEVTTPPLQVIGVYKQSDTSEPTSVTNSVTVPIPSSEILSVLKKNITATTLSIPEDVTTIVKLEVFENIKKPVGVNSDNTTEASFKVTSSFIDSTYEVVNDKLTSNNTITTSATDNKKYFDSAVETSIYNPVNTSSTDKSKSIDTATSVIELINLISTDLPSVVNTKPSSSVLTSLDSLYDNIATTTEQYITKQVTIHGEKVENVTEKIIIPTDIIFTERSVTTDEVSTTPGVNTYIESNLNTTEFTNKIDSSNQTNAVGISLGKSNNTSELVPETTTEYLVPNNFVNVSEPVTVDQSPHASTDNTFVTLGLVDLIADDPKQNAPSTNDYINTFYGNTATATTTDEYTTKLETTLSDKPVIAEVISTNPIINTTYQNVFINDVNNDSLIELNSTVELTSMKNGPETNINYFIPEPKTIGSLQTTTENDFVPITTEANIIFTTDTNDLITNDLLVEKHTTAAQPLQISITTESPIESTDNLYQLNREMNQTTITAKNYTASTINKTERIETVFNTSSSDIINNQVTEPTLFPPTAMKNPAIKLMIAETLQNGLTAHAIEVKSEFGATNAPVVLDESYVENDMNETLLNNSNTTTTVNNNGKSTEPPTKKDSTIEISTAKTLQNDFTTHGIEAKNELPATNGQMDVNEPNLEIIGIKALLSVQTKLTPYNVTSAPVTNTTVKDLASQSDIVANPQTGFTPGIIAFKASDGFTKLDQTTIQKERTNSETKILGSLNQPENLNADQLTKTVVDEGVGGVAMIKQWIHVGNSATTPFSIDVTAKASRSDSVKSDSQDNISATNIVNTQETITRLTKLTSTTPKTVHTTSINVESEKVFEQVSTNDPELLNIYSVPTTDYKIETMNMYPVDVPHTTNIENVTVIPVTTVPPQERTNQKIGTVNQLNTSTTTETVGDLIPSTAAGYDVFNISDLNPSSTKDSVNIDTIIFKVDQSADVSKIETINPMNRKNYVNASLPAINTNKDESIKIVSDLDLVNSSVNAKPNGILQTTSSNSTLSNDYIQTTESQESRVYVTATDNVPGFKYLMKPAELVTQKTPEAIVSLAQTNVLNSNFSTPSTLPITEKAVTVQYTGNESHLPCTEELKHIIDSTKKAVNYASEKTNDYISPTEQMLTKLDKLPKVETESSVSLVSDFTSGKPASPELLKTVSVYDGVTITGSAFIMSSTEETTKVLTDNNIKISTEAPRLTSQVIETQTIKYNAESPLSISELAPVAQMVTEPTHTFNVLAQTTPLDKINQDVLPGITTVDLPRNATSTLNNNISQLMASLPIEGVTTAQVTTEPTHTTNVFAETTPLLAVTSSTNLNEGVLPGTETTDLPQNVLSAINKHILQSMPLLPKVEITAVQMSTEPNHTNNNVSTPIESLLIAEETASLITNEPNHTINVFPQSTPLLAAAGNQSQDVPSGIKTKDLPQYETTMETYNRTQWIGDITTETITDSPIVLDSIVETIQVVSDEVSGINVGDKILGDVMSTNPTVNNANNSLKSVKNIDHESIVIGSSSKNNVQNTPLTLAKSVNMNKAEIVNHTESNWLRSDVNIYSVKIKESSIEAEDSKYSVLKSGTGVQNKTLVSNSSIISKIETKENKNAEIDSSINGIIEIIDVKKYQFQVDSQNISDYYNINNAIANITTSHNNLSLQNSTINDELEQHLISNNHTITTEVQSHFNESDKQSNKTNEELTLNGTSMPNRNLTSIKLNAVSNDTSAITISAIVFNCVNHTRGKYADMKDCRKFYTCIGNLKPIVGTCPNNTVFSDINKQCTRNLSHCVRNNQFRCLFEGRFSDLFKDNIYYICVKNRINGFIRYKIQCQDDYHLNKDSVRCEKNKEISTQSASYVSGTNHDENKPQLKSQKLISTDDFKCENEGKFPYVQDCSKYYVCNQIQNVFYICVKNRTNGFIRYKLQCQDGYHLNNVTVKCEKNQNVSTQSSVSEMNNDDSKPKPKSEKIVSTDDFECENEGSFPYAKDCSKYYVCTKIKNVYRRKIKNCASEEAFDKKKKKCVESDSKEC